MSRYLNKCKRLILKSGLFEEEYYKSQFDTLPEEDLLTYFILNGSKEDKSPSPGFDLPYYLRHNPDVKADGVNPLVHYLTYGKREGRRCIGTVSQGEESLYQRWCKNRRSLKPFKKLVRDTRDIYIIYKSGKFDGARYIERYPDAYNYITKKKTWAWRNSKNPLKNLISRITTTPIGYYVRYGMYKSQNPNESFSTEFYMNNNPDLINGRELTAFVHYLQHGEREQRLCNYSAGLGKSLRDIFKNDFDNNTIKIKNSLSLITEAEVKSEDDLRVEPWSLNTKKASGNILWLNKSAKYIDSYEMALKMFEDEAVMAVVLDKGEKKDYDIISYRDYFSPGNSLKRSLKYESVLFRKPCSGAKASFDTLADFNAALAELCAGGKVAVCTDPAYEEAYTEADNEQIVKIVPVIMEKYLGTFDEVRDFYKYLREIYSQNISIEKFTEAYPVKDYVKNPKPHVMVGVYAFSFGGGEIMPIRLANKLFEMGYTVTVHIYDRKTFDKGVRGMLNSAIPVVYTNEVDNMGVLLDSLGINVVHTHHQAIQSFMGEVFLKYPHLKDRVLNIGTSHGMYEDFDSKTLEYIFSNTPVLNSTDYWTYVADKNLKPFKDFDVYNEDTFIKVPNGMDRPVINKADLSEYGIKDSAFKVAIVSRARIEKGWLHGIEAVKRAREITGKDIQLLLIGAGEVYDQYKDSLGNDFIHFLGFRDNPCDYFGAVDLCMLPSYYPSESAPLCLIEAMMCGIPSIASDIGDVKYILECDGELAGGIFPLDNMKVKDELVTELLVKMVNDRAYYEACQRVAVKKAGYYELSHVADMYIDIYNKAYKPVNEQVAEKLEASNQILLEGEKGTGPLISVIVPNYNHSKYLPMRLDSIFNQTYKNIKVILMDDCSTDNSREILEDYHRRYPDKSVILFNETNSGGVFYQWTKGVLNSTGDICWIAESDDYCEKDFLENVLPAYKDSEVKMSYCQYEFVNENNEPNIGAFFNYVGAIDKEKWRSSYVNDSLDEVSTALGIKNTIPNASGATFRNPGKIDLFSISEWYKMKICGDWIFYLHLLAGGKVAYTVDTKSYFRFHSNNSSAKTYSRDVYYTEHRQVAECIRRLYAPEGDTLEKNYETIHSFYFKNAEDPTEEKFKSLYSLENVSKWKGNDLLNDVSVKAHREKLIKKGEDYKTLVVNPIISASDDEKLSLDEKMNFVGANTGNMVFVDAVKEQTNYVDEIWFNPQNYEKNRKKYDNITAVIPSSNFIIKGSDNVIKSMKRLYLQSEGNITMIGLGAQAYAPNNTPRKLVNAISQEARDFFKMASERCVSIGIRGEFTAECLELMGVRNYRIIGCPTCYKHLDGVYKNLPEPTMDNPIFSITGKSKAESKLLRFGMEVEGDWLLQMMTEMPQLLTEEQVDEELFKRNLPELGLSQAEVRDYMRRKGKIFFNMDKWNEHMRNAGYTFSFGSRFHGNMSALRNGIPALWITHDSRTSELIDVLHLPHISIDVLSKIKHPEQLLEYCDYSEFYKAYPELAKEYAEFLRENEIDSKFTV